MYFTTKTFIGYSDAAGPPAPDNPDQREHLMNQDKKYRLSLTLKAFSTPFPFVGLLAGKTSQSDDRRHPHRSRPRQCG
jgi:hypothetical protein